MHRILENDKVSNNTRNHRLNINIFDRWELGKRFGRPLLNDLRIYVIKSTRLVLCVRVKQKEKNSNVAYLKK